MGNKRLRPKYLVTRIVEEGFPKKPTVKATDPEDIDSPIVLMPRKDPAAFLALLHYAAACEDDLGRELKIWLHKIAAAPPVYGTQGERNRIVMKVKLVEMF